MEDKVNKLLNYDLYKENAKFYEIACKQMIK